MAHIRNGKSFRELDALASVILLQDQAMVMYKTSDSPERGFWPILPLKIQGFVSILMRGATSVNRFCFHLRMEALNA